jgi:hypothetical protein
MEDKLDVWNLKEEDYPVDGKPEERLKFLLRYAILAPSGPNSQPWKLRLEGETISAGRFQKGFAPCRPG